MARNILVVEDDRNISDLIRMYMEKEGFEVRSAYDGGKAIEEFEKQAPDLVLLDLMLPEMNGFEVCKLLRDKGRSTPVLIITAREEEKDKILGLDLGADDYITKPFSIRELMARVKANIRRVAMVSQAQPEPKGEALIFGRLSIDREKSSVTKDGEDLELTPREFELLSYLAAHAGKVFSRQELMERVWNYEGYVGDVRAVDVAVRRLREKVEDDPASPTLLCTKWGVGYYFHGQ